MPFNGCRRSFILWVAYVWCAYVFMGIGRHQSHIIAANDLALHYPTVCGRNIYDARNGTLTMDSEGLGWGRCFWLLKAPAGQLLAVTTEKVQMQETNWTLLVDVDGISTVFKESECSVCLLDRSAGKEVQVTFTFVGLATSLRESPFIIRYVAFDPLRCEYSASSSPKNGTVAGGASERQVSSRTSYLCRTPFVNEANSCLLKDASVPPQSRCQPIDCGKYPVKIAPIDPSRPFRFGHPESVVLRKGVQGCTWELTPATRDLQLVVRVDEDTDLRHGYALELYDGPVSVRRLLTQLVGKVAAARNYTVVNGKLVVVLKSAPLPEAVNFGGFSLLVWSEVPVCERPSPPTNGDVRGSATSDVANFTTTSSIVYSCDRGYQLRGAEQALCVKKDSDTAAWSAPTPRCIVPSLPFPSPTIGNVSTTSSVLTEGNDGLLAKKQSQSKAGSKSRRPHLQNTEEKTYQKPEKTSSQPAIFAVKPGLPDISPEVHEENNSTLPDNNQQKPNVSLEGDEVPSFSGAGDPFVPADYGPDELDDFDPQDYFPEETLVDEFEEEDIITDGGNTGDGSSFPVMALILGIGIPFLLAIVGLASFLVYRKLYPVRMSLGRKFETFENPVYDRNKRGTLSVTGPVTPGSNLAQSPAELQRLTVQVSP